jgi:hypothetical protein
MAQMNFCILKTNIYPMYALNNIFEFLTILKGFNLSLGKKDDLIFYLSKFEIGEGT